MFRKDVELVLLRMICTSLGFAFAIVAELVRCIECDISVLGRMLLELLVLFVAFKLAELNADFIIFECCVFDEDVVDVDVDTDDEDIGDVGLSNLEFKSTNMSIFDADDDDDVDEAVSSFS